MNLVKEVAEHFTHTLWNEKDTSVIDSVMHRDVIIHSLLGDYRGHKAMKEVALTWLNAFPDLIVVNERIISENEYTSIQWKAYGTHLGVFKGVVPCGKKIQYEGVTLYKIQDGKITQYFAYIDMHHLLTQITSSK